MKRETTLKILQAGFKSCQLLLPPLARRWARRMFFTPFKLPRPKREQAAWNSARKELIPIEIDVAREHYHTRYVLYQWGDPQKPTVLLIHGWSGRATQLGVLAEELAENDFNVLAFDALAHGDSPGVHTNVLEFVAIITDIAKKHGPLAGMVGHSLGGVAAGIAHSQGVECAALVTIGSPVTMEYLLIEFGKIIGASRKTLADLQDYTERRIGAAMDDFSPTRLLKDKNLPGLIIHDEQDKESDSSQAPFLHDAWPGSRMIITSGLGHQRILRDPQVASTIKEFLQAEVLQNS